MGRKAGLGIKPTTDLLSLMHVLNSMKPDHRQILFEHMDDKSRDYIYDVVTRLLTSDALPKKKKLLLKSKLGSYKPYFRAVADPKCSKTEKRRCLRAVGGRPMNYVFRAALPMLLNVFK